VSQKYTAVFQHKLTNQKGIKQEMQLILRKIGVEEIDGVFNLEHVKKFQICPHLMGVWKGSVLIYIKYAWPFSHLLSAEL